MSKSSLSKLRVSAVLLVAVLPVVWFFISRMGLELPSEVDLSEVFSNSAISQSEKVCGEVLTSCAIFTELKSRTCTEKSARKRVDAELANPMGRERCQKAEAGLKNSCPAGCVFDDTSLVAIPGKIQFDLFEKDETGTCSIEGHRSLSMSGQCVRA